MWELVVMTFPARLPPESGIAGHKDAPWVAPTFQPAFVLFVGAG